jgi:hypothetical protein
VDPVEAVGSDDMKRVPRFDCFWWRMPMVLFSVLIIAGCSSKEKSVIIDPQPDGITIQHDSRYGSMAAVEADEHCAKYGKVAVFARTIKPDDETLLMKPYATQSVFDCVDSKPAI